MSIEEVHLAKKWYSEGSNSKPSEIASRLGRDKSVLAPCEASATEEAGSLQCAHCCAGGSPCHDVSMNPVVKADAQYAVTLTTLRKTAKVKASIKTIQRALHARNIYFRKLREKPVLTPDDVKARLKFARTFKHKSSQWWNKNVHACLDGKHFKTYLASVSNRKKGMPNSTGSKNSLVMGAVGSGKVLLWYEVPVQWSLPTKRKHVVLEDNDPTGFQSSMGKAAKLANGIRSFAMPKVPGLEPDGLLHLVESQPPQAAPRSQVDER